VWSADVEHDMEIARQFEIGGVRINTALPVFDGPFGGYKDSGIGSV